ncbi:efflux transporter, outer membrane factor (OMF) lipoprotein, NodT family [Hymenobacter daecheongensis DSM 21074]|uniref:Efflux transporter, outer membrane factor (OMF) lipoprotein, NodT family n=1 Tax=Hymenobacter daecheongensis DSM 21074 TaxID=1121955 RepID=A0A1M6LCI9_9BACT|nr:efflux transporter outer membrane subunit [Hymenobacter daecheongensis]SHJ68907.1 efflux transporter, outer membrane factor (OMF) lipoprotein, NodT family [Hymenobacter daecheongensis DSM 21074]
MRKQRLYQCLGAASLALAVGACKTPELVVKNESRSTPASYATATAAATPADSASAARRPWQQFFSDPDLQILIGSALQHNQELNITLQEIEIARNEVRIRQGEYLPFVSLGARTDVEKVGRYTLQGATEENVEIQEGRHTPDPLTNFQLGAFASWEVDIWHKLRNARKAAAMRYLASVEGKNFMTTNLIAEIATSYYELLALDNQLAIVRQNVGIQGNALELVKLQKEAARTTELAVQRFAAQVQHSRALQFRLEQRIVETENRLNYLAGRYPQPVVRHDEAFNSLLPPAVPAGLPAQLLANRPDIRQAEQQLAAAKLDVQVARASFYPALRLTGAAGLAAFTPGLLVTTPQSLLFGLGADLAAPLVNRNGIKALYLNANALQTQAVYRYEKTLLNAYVEVSNQLSNLSNLEKSYDAKAREVAALNQSVEISNSLFRSARADYTEVLFTQREALESKFDLVETRLQQLQASVNVYRALGGGWQ